MVKIFFITLAVIAVVGLIVWLCVRSPSTVIDIAEDVIDFGDWSD